MGKSGAGSTFRESGENDAVPGLPLHHHKGGPSMLLLGSVCFTQTLVSDPPEGTTGADQAQIENLHSRVKSPLGRPHAHYRRVENNPEMILPNAF